MKQLRILGRSIRDAFKSVFRNFSLSMASISCITITLLIVAISMVLSYNIENISTLIKKDFSIVVFVENNATDEDIKNINKVNLVKYGEGIVEQLLSVLEIVDKFLIGIVVALILVTVFLVSNTIKITIFSRRKEIEIMRLVGASNINIKLPFMIEGLFLGLLGSIIPITVTIYGYSILYKSVDMKNISPFLQLVSPTPFIYIVSLVLLGIGVIVGMFGSAGSVRKYLKI